MRYFESFISNTFAGSGSQYFFGTGKEICTGRIFYKISAGGTHRYSLLFSNIIDSTFSNGAVSHCNLICDSWELMNLRVGIFEKAFFTGVPETLTEEQMNRGMKPVTFGGSTSKTVMPGEFFCTDPIELTIEKDAYLCVEMTFSGDMIPNHPESILPAYRKQGDDWVLSKELPYPGMIGCDRAVTGRIGFMGDSITQGCGTPVNAYQHWNALVAEALGEEYAFWNLGLGYGRAADAATDGAWLYKAKHNDIVVVCYGVNDILQGYSAQSIKANLSRIVEKLRQAGCKVFLQTIPPFNYQGEKIDIWLEVNRYIREELCEKADRLFDVVPILQKSEQCSWEARYGGHPDVQGCKAWADALYPELRRFIEETFSAVQ